MRAVSSLAALLAIGGCRFEADGAGKSAVSISTSGATEDSTSGGPTGTAGSTAPATTDATTEPSGSETGPASWWDPAWATRVRISFDSGANTASLDGFPALVVLNPERIDYAGVQSGGQDLRFVDADDATQLPYEIERWVPGGISFIWVRVPQIDPGTDNIFMYWGNEAAMAGQNPLAVWSEGYAGVWHMASNPEDAAPQILDATPLQHHGTAVGQMTVDDRIPGPVGLATEFDGADDLVTVGDLGSDDWLELTLSAWVRRVGDGDDRIVCKSSTTTPEDHIFALGIRDADYHVRLSTDGIGATYDQLVVNDVLPVANWVHLGATWSAADPTLRAYVDGDLVGSAALGGETVADSPQAVVLANINATDDRLLAGAIDEVRIATVARSTEWMTSQYRSMQDSFASFGPPEQAP